MSIQECFSGKNIFLTGFTGVIGKALVEKLLRSCSDVGNIYVLLRSRKGKNIHERIQMILNVPLFDLLRNKNPDAFKKIKPIAGNVNDLALGISEEDKRTIFENVNIVFHGAATVRFDDHLIDAIITNVRGTREMIKLSLQMKNLIAFIHMSTTYCNIQHKVIEEKIYPAPMDWKDAINIAENCSHLQLTENLTEKIIHPFPNTYTFTKLLGEHVVNDLCQGKIPTAVVRPSIVCPVWEDPLEGWMDTLSGIAGIMTGVNSGLLRELHAKGETRLNNVPLDFVNRILILSVLKRILVKNWNEILVYNCCIHNRGVSLLECAQMGDIIKWTHPATNLLWYPQIYYNPYLGIYQYSFIITHLIPAIMYDVILRVMGVKPRVLTLSRKGYLANMHLTAFMTNTWFFKNNKVLKLGELVEGPEKENFSLDTFLGWEFKEYLQWVTSSKVLTFEYLLKIKIDPVRGTRVTRLMWLIDRIAKTVYIGLIFYFLYCLVCKYINYVRQL